MEVKDLMASETQGFSVSLSHRVGKAEDLATSVENRAVET